MPNLSVFVPLVPDCSRVLDLKCGAGDLLALLKHHRAVEGFGLDPDEAHVVSALEKGLSVIHAPIEETLSDYPTGAFDVVVLNHTLQTMANARQVLQESLRIGKRVMVMFPNFAYAPVRLKLLLTGRMPHTDILPFQWYDTPNIHLFTVADLKRLCQAEGITIQHQSYEIAHHWTAAPALRPFANTLSNQGLFVLTNAR